VALSTLTILVLYPMWTGASDRSKSWRRIITVTVWVHVGFLLFINLIVGSRFIP
jgi:MFS-type transporter involved in bile tolerance (Atg22 family)